MKKHFFLVFIAVAFIFAACDMGGKKNSNTETTPEEVVVEQADAVVEEQILLYVGGSCGMCTDRIIATVSKVDGFIDGSYDLEDQELNVTFDVNKTSVDAISKALADVGHDTELYKADDEVYAALPGCCHYRD